MSTRSSRAALEDETWAAVMNFFMTRKEVFLHVAVEFGLTPGDLQALMSLDPDEPKPMKSLAESFRCDPSNATWMVDRLEQRGIVERQTLAHDRRIRAVAFTKKGLELRGNVIARLHAAPPEFARLTDDELKGLRETISRLGVPAGDCRAD